MSLGAWLQRHLSSPPAEAPALATFGPRSGILEKTLRVSGQLVSRRSALVVAPKLAGSRSTPSTPGQFSLILHTLAHPGALVRPGERIAEFDSQYMRLWLNDLRSDLEQRRSLIQRQEAQLAVRRKALDQRLTVARSSVEKARLDLSTAPVRSQIQVERYRLRLGEWEARLAELRKEAEYFDISEQSELRRQQLELRIADLERRRAEKNLEQMSVLAPMDGIVVMGQIQRGGDMHEVEAGDQVHPGHAFVQVMDPADLRLDAAVNQADIHEIRLGAPAHVHLDSVDGVDLEGRVESIGSMASVSRYRPDWVRQIPVRVRLDARDARLFPHASASADIVVAWERAAVIVPRHCLHGETIMVRQGEGWTARGVRLGLANHLEVVVREGLESSQVIACQQF